jgi:hypothetical protein
MPILHHPPPFSLAKLLSTGAACAVLLTGCIDRRTIYPVTIVPAPASAAPAAPVQGVRCWDLAPQPVCQWDL